MMNDMTRRNAIQALAAGVAVSGAVAPANASTVSNGIPPAVVRAAREVADRLGDAVDRPQPAAVHEAHVLLVRSWDRRVYLYIHDGLKGFVALDEAGFAVAAACQSSGRKAAVQVWGHAPEWAGVGRFDGALIATDPRDFPRGGAAL